MQLKELKSGVQLCAEIRIDSPLDAHHDIALYLATDTQIGHSLVHVLPDVSLDSLQNLQKTAAFYRAHLQCDVRAGHYEDLLYFAEPFPLGEFMYEWLERRERIKPSEAIKRVIALLRELQTAHENGIFHGRITPKSILFEQDQSSYKLRLMGLGISQILPEKDRYDLDWLDYSFDLEGMSPVAIDIYGMAIVLMGLVSGEPGIDSFEATGLLPPALRGGLIQQAMERALALRVESYSTVFAFCLDLEAALLELDDRQGEVYVADLVGFESAIRSISPLSSQDDRVKSEDSGVWSSMFDTLEQEERSSILCSLTSLNAIPSNPNIDDDEDDDVTCVTSMPAVMTNFNRIKSAHAHDAGVSQEVIASDSHDETGDTTRLVVRPPLTIPSSVTPTPSASTAIPAPTSTDQDEDSDLEDDDEAPTRIMLRPNYASVSIEPHDDNAEDAIADVVAKDLEKPETLREKPSMEERIQNAVIIEADLLIQHDVLYALDDPVAFPPEPEQPHDASEIKDKVPTPDEKITPKPQTTKRRRTAPQPTENTDEETFVLTNTHKIILVSLCLLVVILAVILILCLI